MQTRAVRRKTEAVDTHHGTQQFHVPTNVREIQKSVCTQRLKHERRLGALALLSFRSLPLSHPSLGFQQPVHFAILG
jgi:hypothetical protein